MAKVNKYLSSPGCNACFSKARHYLQGLCVDHRQPLLAGARFAQQSGKALIILLSKCQESAAGLFGKAK